MAQIFLFGELPVLHRICALARIGSALQVLHQLLSRQEVCISNPPQDYPAQLNPRELMVLSLLVTTSKAQVQ